MRRNSSLVLYSEGGRTPETAISISLLPCFSSKCQLPRLGFSDNPSICAARGVLSKEGSPLSDHAVLVLFAVAALCVLGSNLGLECDSEAGSHL